MKRVSAWLAAAAIASIASLSFATPAFAAPVAQTPISTIGGSNFVSTSADGSITAAYSGSTGLSVYNSTTQLVTNYTAASLSMTTVGEAVVSPDGTQIYLLGSNPQSVAVFDVESEAVTRTIALPFAGWMGAITPDGSTLLVYAKTTKQMVKIALATDTVSAPLALGLDYPYQLCVTSDGSTVYVPGYDAGYTSIVDIGSFAETGRLLDAGGPLNCALGADDTLYIGDYDTGTIRKYAADGSFISSDGGLVEEMYGMGLTCNSVIVGDYQNLGYKILDRWTLAQTGTLDSADYTYMMSVNRAATVTWVGGYTAATGLQEITESTCELPDTGLDATTVGILAAVSAGLIAAGVIALIVVRRRRNG